jgi:hypothetical protein
VYTYLLIFSVLLLMDTMFSLFHFKYTYFFELKRRYANSKEVPYDYRQKLKGEIKKEVGTLRTVIQFTYIPWIVLCFLSPLWVLPVFLTLTMFLTNLFYNKPYISPLALLNLLCVFLWAYCFTIYAILTKFV